MKSRQCPDYRPGLCPDTERRCASGFPADLVVVLPYCAGENHEKLVLDVLAPACGFPPGRIMVDRTIACRLESEPSFELLRHCAETRLANSILHSGAAAVLAVGRGAAECRYPAPAFFCPDPASERAGWDAVFSAFRSAAAASQAPEIVRDPSPQRAAEALDGSSLAGMHVSGGLLYWRCSPHEVFCEPADPSSIELVAAETRYVASFCVPRLLAMAPQAVSAARWLDVSAALMLPREPDAPDGDPYGEWRDTVLDALAALDESLVPGARQALCVNATRESVQEFWRRLDPAVSGEVELVAGPPPEPGSRSAAWLADRAARIAEGKWFF